MNRTQKSQIPSYLNFEADSYGWKPHINYRNHPELYKVGKGEQGVLICQPYKNEIGRYWRFATPEKAEISSNQIFHLFQSYLDQNDFVGADMARKYLQMGFTRSRRYANYRGGKKYSPQNFELMEKGTGDPNKALSAEIFFKKWKEAELTPKYHELKSDWKKKFG